MSKNTAMTDMINYLTRLETLVGNNYSDEIKGYITGAKTEATELLTKEREDILQFHIDCVKAGTIFENAEAKFIEEDEKLVRNQAEKYYETTFNQ